jgi:DNA-binding HxlR family transcriptional regulator
LSTTSAAGFPVRQRSDSSSGVNRPPRSDLDLIERIEETLGVLHGKWKVRLLFLMARGNHRHSTLLRCLPGASKKVMIDTLRALERDGLVNREIFAEVPVRVEYSLTNLGWTTTEPLIALSDWGKSHGREVAAARARTGPGEPGKGHSRKRAGRRPAAS